MFNRKPALLLSVLGCTAVLAPSVRADDTTIYLGSPARLDARFQGPEAVARSLNNAKARPLAMASGDFDGDGMADLAVGYATAQGGVITIFRGNLDAFAPQSQASFEAIGRGQFPPPYVGVGQTIVLAEQPDFLAAGMLIGHDRPALIAAARGGHTIYVLAPDDSGVFQVQQNLDVGGAITALASYRLVHGAYAQVVAGIHATDGSALLVYTGSNEGLSATASFPLSGDASAFAYGNLDGDAKLDLLVLAGGRISILHGGSQTLEPISLPFTVSAIALGTFVSDRDPLLQMALLADDGSVHFFTQASIDSRPYTLDELHELKRANRLEQDAPTPPPQQRQIVWQESENFPGVGAFDGAGLAPQFFQTRITGNGADDIMIIGGGRLSVIAHPGQNPAAGVVLTRPEQAFSLIAALPLRVNIDGRPGVVFVQDAEAVPFVMMPLPDPTFFVNRFDDPSPGAVGSTCNNANNGDTSSSCSLREAVRKANATAGADTIMLVAGTYTLSLARQASPTYDATAGSLDVTDSLNIVGATDGGGNPTSIILGGSTSSNGVDQIFRFNPDESVFTNATISISNLVLKWGFNRGAIASPAGDGDGGAFYMDTGGTTPATATGSLTVTNCIIENNQMTDGEGGGVAAFNTTHGPNRTGATGFAITIINSIVQNNTAKRSNPGAGAQGGGIQILFPSSMLMTNTQVLNNSIAVTGTTFGAGGGIMFLGGGGVFNESTIHGGVISGNGGSLLQGGGIFSGAGLTIDQGTVISNNTSQLDGGGIWWAGHTDVGAENLTLTKVTITGNAALGAQPGGNGGVGGGLFLGNGNTATPAIHFSRLAGNTQKSGVINNLFNQIPTSATNNWWGTNAASSTITDNSGGVTTFDPFIVLTHTASPNKIRINQSTTLTADMSKDNHGNGANLSGNLDRIIGVPITFNNAVDGSITGPQATIQNNGMATATFNAGNVAGGGKADAVVDQQTVTANIIVLQPPSIAKSFSPTTVAVGVSTTITFSITNPNVVTIDSGFVDTLPTNMVVAATPNAVNNCGGTLTANAGASTITFANPALPVSGSPCTIKVDVKATVDNNYTNSVQVTSSDAGNGNTAMGSVTVINPPTIAKLFGAATIPLNSTTSLTITLTSTNANLTLTGVAFTDTLTSGLIVATPGNLSSTCNGTATAADGSSSVSLSGASLAPGASCTVTVTVAGATAGVKPNSVQANSTNGGLGNTSSVSITVVAPPTISKAFAAPSIPLNTNTTVTFTIMNPNGTVALSGINFSDSLPAGLLVASTPNVGGTCVGTVSATGGANSIGFSSGTLAASGTCTVKVDVTGTTAGFWSNTTTAIGSTEGGTGATSNTATITVVAPPTIAKAFGAATIGVGQSTTVTFTITNPAANTVSQIGVAFSDPLPSGLTVASTPGVVGNCGGGTVTAASNGTSISLANGTVSVNTNCTIQVNVTGTIAGVKNNTTGAVSSSNGGTGAVSNTATLTVLTQPTIAKAFNAPQIPLGGSSTITFTITNTNAVGLTGLAFSDSLTGGLQVAGTPNQNFCNGTLTATGGATTISLAGGTIAANATCTISVDVTATTAGAKLNTTGVLSSTEAGPGAVSNTATLTVVAPPTINKSFAAGSIPLNTNTTVTFAVTNPNGTVTLTNVTFSDPLPAGLVVANSPNVGGTCGGTPTAAAGSGSISMTALSVSPNSTCTFTVSVTGTTAGSWNNTTSIPSSTEGGNGVVSNTATIVVVAPPTIAKAFGASNLALNGTTTVTFTITNPAANTVSQTGVAFNDPLPSGLTVASTPGVVGNCGGGTVTAASNGTSISLSGGTIGTNTNCTIQVNVTGTTAGVKNNTTGAVSSTNGGTGTVSNTATVTVAAAPTISKAFTLSQIPLGGSTTVTFTLTNPNSGLGLTNVSFSDSLPSGLVVASTPAVGGTCTGTVGATGGSSSIGFANGTLAASASCTLSVNVTGMTAGVKNNTTGTISSTESGTGATSNTATLTVVAPPGITKAFSAPSVPLNGTATITFTISNPNGTVGLTGIGFNDPLPAGLVVANPPNAAAGTCTATFNPNAGDTSLTVSGISLGAGLSCTVKVDVKGTAAGNQANTTGSINSVEGGMGTGSNTATIAVVAPPTIAKAFAVGSIPVNTSTTVTFTITNPAANTVAQTGVAFNDPLPTGLTVATTPGVVGNCGGGTVTANSNGTSISLSGGTVGINTNCTITVNVTGTTEGLKANTTGAVSSTNGGTGVASNTANLTVGQPAAITKAFGASQIPLNTNTSLTFTLNNPNSVVDLTGVAFSDSLPSGLVVANSPGVVNGCGGTVTANGGSGAISLANGSVTHGTMCTISLNVTGTTAGVKNNTTGPISSNEGGTGSASNTATVTVVGPPTIMKAFTLSSIPLNGSTTVTFTIANPNGTVGLTGVSFSDTLVTGLVVASTPNLMNTCNGTPTASGSTISLAAGTIVAGGSCTLKVDVTGTTAGDKLNTTGAIGSTEGGTGSTSNTAMTTVVAPPVIGKAFGASNIGLNTNTTVTFTITNPAANTASETSVAFGDTLPSGLTVANTPGVVNGCGGSVTAAANGSSISLTNGTVGVNTNCTVVVNVTGTTVGLKTNTTGQVTSSNGGTGNTATATVTVSAADLTVGKTHNPSTFIVNDVGDTIPITVTNIGNAASSGTVTVADMLPTGLTFTGTPSAGWTCTSPPVVGPATVTCTTTTNVIAASGGTSVLTLTVNVASSTAATLTNNVSVACTCTESNTGNNTGSDMIPVSQAVGITLDTRADLNATPKLMISADGGTSFTAPHTYQFVPGSMHTITTTSPQTNGTTYNWVRWSDSGAISHSITTPGSPATITADFGGTTYIGGGFGLKTGPTGGQRVWTVNIGNNGPGAALNTQVTSLTLVHTLGPACNPTVVSAMPVSAGDIVPGGTAPAQVTIDFTGCASNSFFTVTANISANNGAVTGQIKRFNQVQ